LGYDLNELMTQGYVGSGSHLDAQMSHDIEEALHQRVRMHDKLYVTSMRRWIDSYITPMNLPGCYYVIIIDIDREQKHLAEVERLRLIDALTDVGNRNALQVALNRLRTQDIPLGVLAADLNNLKRINDEQGHAAGDQAIAETAALLKESFTDWDISKSGSLTDGASQVASGASTLARGLDKLSRGTGQALDGSRTLSSSLASVKRSTNGLDDKVIAHAQKYVDKALGKGYQPHSFVDGRNKNVNEVQFVYVVSGIDKPEVDKIQPESPDSNDNVSFLDRLKALFS
jgi:X-X-X-Leu-X-X-Gly heptad repeat protein